MRLIDADALNLALGSACDEKRQTPRGCLNRFDLADILRAQKTIACERCEHHKPKFNNVGYPWCSPVGYHHQDFGCVHFKEATDE